MNILVTGGCGYIGSVLVPKLLEQGHSLTVYDIQWFGNHLAKHENLTVLQGDIRDIDRVPMEGMEAIIHLANVANDPCGDLNSKLVWEVNALATMLLVEKAIDNGLKQFLHASSGSVYGIKDEEQVTEELSLKPISDYNKTKMISERVLLSYQDQIGVQIVRPATVCGFSDRTRLDVSVNMLTMQAMKNKLITVFGGKQVRPNIHIQDICNVFIHFLDNPEIRGIFNAGFENVSILGIAELISEKIPCEIQVTESNDPRSYRLNSDKLVSSGFSRQHGIEYAIGELKSAFESGKLEDIDNAYNIRTMKKLFGG